MTMNEVSKFLLEILSGRGILPETIKWIDGPAMPQPYRGLLVHERDMTSTLEAYYDSKVSLEVVNVTHEKGEYVREVLLNSQVLDKAVEYGAIEVVLDHFPAVEKEAIIAGREPLGSILNNMDHPYFSRPRGFFSIVAPKICQERFGCGENDLLYGRYNKLSNGKNETLASIIEIMPPC